MAVKKAKVLVTFLKENTLKKTEIGDEVISGISAHPLVFASPAPPLAELSAINNNLRTKTVAALNGDKIALEERNASEKEWDKKFSKAARYVDDLADGDTLIIEQSGFKSTKTETYKKAKPGQALIKVVKGDYTTRGKIDIKVEKLSGADSFFAIATQQPLAMKINKGQIIFSPQAELALSISTTRKISIEDLQSKQEYEVIVFGCNTAGIGSPSQVARVVVP